MQSIRGAVFGAMLAVSVPGALGPGAVVVGAVLTGAAAAERVAFEIPAQPLVSALDAFSRTSRVQVLYESELAAGLSTRGAVGRFTPEAALETLLAGTDLRIRFTRPDAVVLMRPTTGADGEASKPLAPGADLVLRPLKVEADEADADRFRAYAGVIRADIERALKQDGRTKAGTYVAGLRLWIGTVRAVQKAELVRSTGDSDRDAAISRVLTGLVVSEAPPPRMPNPISVMITVRVL